MSNEREALKKITSYCNSILNRPLGCYSAEAIVIAEVIKDLAEESLKDEHSNN